MTMATGKRDQQAGPDAAAGTTPPAAGSRAEPDNARVTLADADDPPGLPLTIVLLDAPQPYDEASASAGDDPPPLVRASPYDARDALGPKALPDNLRVVYAGGPKALTAGYEAQWDAWWTDNHGLVVSTAGWCVYRDWDAAHPTRMVPKCIVMELPCLTMDGERRRVRAAVPPAFWRLASELTIATRSAALVPLNLTMKHEAEVGAQGFADRWAAWKARRR